jgi:dTDP-4-dehydrorhamnose reductase
MYYERILKMRASMGERILITGGAGQVGTELTSLLSQRAEVISLNRQACDLSNLGQISTIVKSYSPSAIINAAAYTNVDRAETEVELVRSIDGLAPGILAVTARELNIPLIHLSTDYVFDGRNSTPYLETDPTAPSSVYGQAKREGEMEIERIGGKYLNLRTAWVYGSYGKSNFVKTMLRLGSTREEIRVVSDQIGTPTWAKTIATTIDRLLPQLALGELESGTYHLTNSGVASWYDFAIAIFDRAKILGFPLKVKTVIPITTAEYPTPAVRPNYSVLSHQKLSRVLQYTLPHWQQDLAQMLQELKYLTDLAP